MYIIASHLYDALGTVMQVIQLPTISAEVCRAVALVGQCLAKQTTLCEYRM